MKAHIYKEPRTVLLWNFGPQSAGFAGVEQAARRHGASVKLVSGKDVGQTVGQLCGLPGSLPVNQLLYLDDEAYPPAMIASGLGGEIDPLIDEINAAGARLPLKAIVTQHNRAWTLAHLLEELLQEHQALHPQSEGAEQ